MNFEMLHPADQIVMIMNRIYYHGMTTTTGGNLSIRDSEGTVWISPSGVDISGFAPEAEAPAEEPVEEVVAEEVTEEYEEVVEEV